MRLGLFVLCVLVGIQCLVRAADEPPPRPLSPGLRDPDPSVRRVTARRMVVRTAEIKQSIPALIAALDDKDLGVKNQCVRALVALAPDSIHALTQAAKNDVPARRSAALYALSEFLKQQETVSREHLKLFASVTIRDGDSATRRAAIEAFRKLGDKAEPIVPVFVEMLKNPDLRKTALEALGAIGPSASPAVPMIAQLLGDADFTTRSFAIGALGGIGAASADAMPQLLKLFGETSHKDELLRAFQGIGPGAKLAVPNLIALMDQAKVDRYKVLQALEKIGPGAEAAVPAVLEIAKDPQAQERLTAIRVLGATQTSNKAVVQFLLDVMLVKNYDAQTAASKSFRQIKTLPPEVAPLLVKCIESNYSPVQEAAAEAFGRIGPEARKHIPALLALARVEKPNQADIQIYSCKALGGIGAETIPMLSELAEKTGSLAGFRAMCGLALAGPQGTEKLIEYVRSKNPDKVRWACEALKSTGAAAVSAVPALIEISGELGSAPAREALQAIGAPAVPELRAALDSTDVKIRRGVLDTLRGMGPVAAETLPRLIELLDDRNQGVRGSAVVAIGAMRDEARVHIPMLIQRYSRLTNGYDRDQYLFAFEYFGPDAKALLPTLLNDPTRKENSFAKSTIGTIGTPAHQSLYEELAAGEYKIISDSTHYFGRHKRDMTAFDPILSGAESSQAVFRLRSALAFGVLGPNALHDNDLIKVIRQVLEKLRTDADPNVRVAAIWSAQRVVDEKIGFSDTRKQLFTELKLCAIPIRWYAVCALIWQPNLKELPESRDAIPFLKTMVQADQELARRAARIALDMILDDDPAAARVAKAEATKSASVEVRIDALERIHVKPETVHVILDALRDPHVDVQIRAIRLLPAVHKISPLGLPVLMELFKENHEPLREELMTSVAVVGAEAAPIVLRILRTSPPESRETPLLTLMRLGDSAAVCFPELAKLLQDPDEGIQGVAVDAVLHIGAGCLINVPPPNWEPVVQPLMKIVANPKSPHRENAAFSVSRVRPVTEALVNQLLAISAKEKAVGPLVDTAVGRLLKNASPELQGRLGGMGNEIEAAAFCVGFVFAQREYKETDWDKDGVMSFAPTLKELLDRNLGFVEEDMVAAEGPPKVGAPSRNGYRFKLLQSSINAAGKLESFLVNGKLTRGIAMVAYPIEYGKTGKLTFLVSPEGEILKQDLGAQTLQVITKMESFRGGAPWQTHQKLDVKPASPGNDAQKPPTAPGNF